MSLEEKRRELQLLENQAQQEHEAHALEKVRAAFKGKSRIFGTEMLTSIKISPGIQSFMSSQLQGGAYTTEFFKIGLNIKDADGTEHIVTISANANRDGMNRPETLTVTYKDGNDEAKTNIETPFQFDDKDYNVSSYYPKVAVILGFTSETPYEEAIVTLGEFWGHLMSALTIYMAYMKNCPKKHLSDFQSGHFGHLFSHVCDSYY